MAKLNLCSALLLLLTALPSHADWQYTKWGMTEDQVLRGSKGAAASLEQTDKPYFISAMSSPALWSPYESGNYKFKAYFFFEEQSDKLTQIILQLQNPLLKDDLLVDLKQKYGEPKYVYPSSRIDSALYKWDSEKDLVQFVLAPNVRSGEFRTIIEVTYRPRDLKDREGL